MSFASRNTLGLDIGSASIGWSLIDPENRRVAAGARIFDPGVDLQKFEKGEEGSSKNVDRRTARLHRRQLRRREGRQNELFCLLQKSGLMPSDSETTSKERGTVRHAILTRLDSELTAKWSQRIQESARAIAAPDQTLLYALRAFALDEPLQPEEIGRILYQLSQRRGFKSNRREGKGGSAERGKKNTAADERSKVKQGIKQLKEHISASGARTLGEYFSRLDPAEARIRTRWTSRQMFLDEFEQIWTKQAGFHPALLTAQLKGSIHPLLFFQRPIADGKPGKCELEPNCDRAPMASLEAQRFRLLQKVNDLEVITNGFNQRPLSPEERGKLLAELESTGGITFTDIRKLLGLPKNIGFNLEKGGEKKLRGNRTAETMLRAFGERWGNMNTKERTAAVQIWLRTEDEDELASLAMKKYRMEETAACHWAQTEPEDGYSKLSRKALQRLLPHMEGGMRFKEAEKLIYGANFSGGKVYDRLAPVKKILPQIPNPAVTRALTELRKVVNAICREYGKPAEVRIELARDIKRNAAQREATWRGMREQEKRREEAAKQILKETGNQHPSRDDIERALLLKECAGICVYCGNSLGTVADVFNQTGYAQVDHIFPWSRFPDNGFGNKTLAHVTCNQQKGNRTPHKAFSYDPELWDAILCRVRSLKNNDKLERFQISSSEELEGFSERRLSDTRYITKLAARYLGTLYGGRDVVNPDGSTRRVVFTSSGLTTATLRKAWGLEAILREASASANGQNPGKPRTDHRHHAVDAIVIALTSNVAVQQMSAAAAAGDGRGFERISSRTLQAPWENFVESVRPSIEQLHVSHRPSHKLNGALHKDTNYSKPRKYGKKDVVHIRKLVHELSEKQILDETVIVDRRVREAVQTKLQEVDGNPKKLETEYPVLKTRKGATVPIRKVRIRVPGTVETVGEGSRERYISTGNNHHIAIFSTRDKKGRLVWESPGVVSRLDAMRRRRRGEPIIEKKLPGSEDAEFVFSLMGGDMVEMDHPKEKVRTLWVVPKMSEAANGRIEIGFVRHNDARRDGEREMLRLSVDQLRRLNCRKVIVDVLGRVREAHD